MNGKQKKVFLLNHGLSSGGTDSFVINVIKTLNKDKYDVSVVMALDENNIQFREQEAIKLGAKIYRTCDLNCFTKFFKHLLRLYILLKKEKPDVLHANMDLFNGLNLFIAWIAGVPIRVCHSHNSKSQFEEQTGKTFFVTVYRAFMREMIWLFSNRRCGCSSEAMDYLYKKRWTHDDKSMIIYNGIELIRFRNCKNSNLKTEMGVSDKKILVSVGRLSDQKNPMFIIKILRKLKNVRKDWCMLWVGEGELEKKIKLKLIESDLSNFVFMLGKRNDVEEILSISNCFLFPSKFEGLGIVLIEAQAANVQCIVSDSVPKIADCGKMLFLPIGKNDENIWVDEINNILNGMHREKIDNEKMEKFDIVNLGKQLEEVYN